MKKLWPVIIIIWRGWFPTIFYALRAIIDIKRSSKTGLKISCFVTYHNKLNEHQALKQWNSIIKSDYKLVYFLK